MTKNPPVNPSRSEPESASGPWPSGAGVPGAAQKSGGSATLLYTLSWALYPHSFFADLDLAVFLNADPDPA